MAPLDELHHLCKWWFRDRCLRDEVRWARRVSWHVSGIYYGFDGSYGVWLVLTGMVLTSATIPWDPSSPLLVVVVCFPIIACLSGVCLHLSGGVQPG